MDISGHVLGLSPAGFHKMAYATAGQAGDPLTVCVHGLTRNHHDFDDLAMALAARGRHVVAPDVVGRGASDWLPHPDLYSYPQYLADMAVLLAAFGDPVLDWVGTSMGGLMGMMLAAQPHTPIRKLVLNDVGPFIPKDALEGLAAYVGSEPTFGSVEEAQHYLRIARTSFGIESDAAWDDFTRHSLIPAKDGAGGYQLAYDPAIGQAFKTTTIADLDLWPLWQAIRCPVLVLRGASSTLLTKETATRMAQTGPCAQVIEIEGAGHAPALITPARLDPIVAFLEG